MERVSRIIGNLAVPESPLSAEQVVLAAWPRAVGKRLAAHARALRMVGKRLVIEVEDNLWQRNLFGLSRHILSNLSKHVGPGVVDDLEFKVYPRRREAQRASVSTPLLDAHLDDAEAIRDPGLRRIYKAARRRETA